MRYHSSQSVTCEGRRHVLEMRVAPGQEPNLRLFWCGADGRFGGRDWHLPEKFLEGEAVVLVASYPQGRLSGLDDAHRRELRQRAHP